jgi:hypothetical protein
MLEPIDTLRASARAHPAEAFGEKLGGPVLLRRETLAGDLQYADPEDTIPVVRPGATLLFESERLTARDRLTLPRQSGRKAVPEQVFVMRTGQKAMFTVGRAPDNDLVLKDPSVSQRHARLHVLVGTDWVFATDAGSRNGVGHNEKRVAAGERAELLSGDEISFGSQVFVFLTLRDLHKYLTGTL